MIDEAYSELAGQPLESLGFISSRQRFEASGPVVPADALGILARADRRGRLQRSDRAAPSSARLVAAGLVDDRWSLTPIGEQVRAHWQGTSPLLEVQRRGAVEGTLIAWAGSGTVLVAASAAADDPSFADEHIQLGIVSVDSAVPAIASWMNLVPVWSFSDGPLDVSGEAYEARLGGRAPDVPSGAGSTIARIWAAPRWTEYASRSPQRSLRFVVSPEGYLSVMLRGDTARLAAVTPRTVFTTLLEQYGDALSQPLDG